MRSIKRELETKRDALTSAISSSTRSSREDDHRREVFKDPFGMASITHDDEVVAAVVDTRARQLEEIDRVYRAYPHLNDDDFVAQHRDEWLHD